MAVWLPVRKGKPDEKVATSSRCPLPTIRCTPSLLVMPPRFLAGQKTRELGSRLDALVEKVIESHTLLGWRRVPFKVSSGREQGATEQADDRDAR